LVLDNLPNDKFYAHLNIPLDHLLAYRPFYKEALHYLIACQVESKSPRTIEVYSRVISDFLKFNSPTKPTADDIRLFMLQVQSTGVSTHTQHIYFRTLKTFFSWLIGEKIITHSPMQSMKAPRLPSLVIQPFDTDDIKRLLVVTSGNRFIDFRNRAIILMFLDTGIRLAEMAGLQLGDVDIKKEAVKVTGKGRKERLVRIGKTSQKAILSYMLRRSDSSPQLWLTEERGPLTKDGLNIAIRRLCKRADVHSTKHGVHTFRHTAAINYLRNGGDQFTLQVMLGHSSLEMTRRYVSTLGAEDMMRVHQTASPVDNLFRQKEKTPGL